MNRLMIFAVALVVLAYGIREGLDFYQAYEEKRRAETRALLIVQGLSLGGEDTVGLAMWQAGRRTFDGPPEAMGVMDAAYRRWLGEKGIGVVESAEVIGSRRLVKSELFGLSTWAVGVDVEGREHWMELTLDEPAEWIERPPLAEDTGTASQ